MKYFFAYNTFNNKIFPVKWMEDEGKPVGGKPKTTTKAVEISKTEFGTVGLAKLQQTYPFYSDDVTATKTG